jgi:hypothetical protein
VRRVSCVVCRVSCSIRSVSAINQPSECKQRRLVSNGCACLGVSAINQPSKYDHMRHYGQPSIINSGCASLGHQPAEQVRFTYLALSRPSTSRVSSSSRAQYNVAVVNRPRKYDHPEAGSRKPDLAKSEELFRSSRPSTRRASAIRSTR